MENSFLVILECNIDIIEYLMNSGSDLLINDNNGYDFRKHCELIAGKYMNVCLKGIVRLEDDDSTTDCNLLNI